MLLWWGVALAFKAQAIFLAPFVAGILIAKRAEWHSWLIPPAVYAAFMLPAWALGWPAADLALVYVRQAGTFADLSMNAPNIWVIVQDVPGLGALPLTHTGFAAAAAAGVFLIFGLQREADADRLILLALISALLLPGLLPRMHERYFLLADLLAFTYAVRRRDLRGWMIFGAVEIRVEPGAARGRNERSALRQNRRRCDDPWHGRVRTTGVSRTTNARHQPTNGLDRYRPASGRSQRDFALAALHPELVPKGSKTMIAKQIFLAVTVALIAVPASQRPTAPKAGKSAAVDQKKYCIAYDNVVGSRVSRQECKTKAEWAKERVDIDKMLKE